MIEISSSGAVTEQQPLSEPGPTRKELRKQYFTDLGRQPPPQPTRCHNGGNYDYTLSLRIRKAPEFRATITPVPYIAILWPFGGIMGNRARHFTRSASTVYFAPKVKL